MKNKAFVLFQLPFTLKTQLFKKKQKKKGY